MTDRARRLEARMSRLLPLSHLLMSSHRICLRGQEDTTHAVLGPVSHSTQRVEMSLAAARADELVEHSSLQLAHDIEEGGNASA